jgi:hypothetical protein
MHGFKSFELKTEKRNKQTMQQSKFLISTLLCPTNFKKSFQTNFLPNFLFLNYLSCESHQFVKITLER